MHGCKNGALFALVFLVLSSSNSAAQVATLQGATLLADMSAGPQARNGMAGLPVRVGEKLFFVAHARGAGTELHVSDANLEQIRLVTDLYPGLGGSSISGLQALGDGVVFVADDSRGRALWTSDGTAAGTYRIVPTPGLLEFDPIYPNPLTVVDDCVWFGADDGVIGAEPWRYCAHDRQLTLIGDLEPGAASSSPGPFYAVGERVLFETTSGIFVIDARSLEPRRFVVPEAPDLVILHQQTIEFRSRLYFAGTTAEHGREMWVTDGTESGTALLADLVPGPTSSRPTGKIVFNDTFYFAAEMPGVGHALLRFDGDTVEPAADLHSGAGMLYYLQSDGQRLVISAQGDDGELELWQSDGTQEGSKQLRFPDGTDFSLAYGLTRINDRSVIIAETWQQGIELWTLGEGDDASLSQVMDIQPGPRWGVRSTLLEFDDTLVFLGSSPETGVELWQTSGTPESTRLRLNLGQDDNADSDYFVGSNDGNDTVLFGPGVGRNDRAVWLTDATPAGTRRVRNFPALIDYNGETYPPTLLGAAPTDMGTTFAFSNPLQQQSSQWIVREGRVSRIGQFGIANPKAFGDGVIGVGVNGGVLRTTGEKGSVEKVFDPSVAVAGRIYPRMEIEDDLAWFFADTPDNRVALWRCGGRMVRAVVPRAYPMLR